MKTYKVHTHGIYSSHMARAGLTENSAYDVTGVSVTDHAVWWLTIIPIGADHTIEIIYDPMEGSESYIRAYVEKAWPSLERLGLGDPGETWRERRGRGPQFR